MGHKKTSILLNETSDSKFVTRKEDIINDQSNTNYIVGNKTMCKTEALKSDIYDFNGA